MIKKEEFWKLNDHVALHAAKVSIHQTICQLKRLFLQSSGNQWKIAKFHKQLHVAYNIFLYGCHLNIHTGPQEHNHIANDKKPSQRTQKCKQNFDNQIGNRLNDQYAVSYNSIQISLQQSQNTIKNENLEVQKHIQKTKMASKFHVTIMKDATTGQVDVNMIGQVLL